MFLKIKSKNLTFVNKSKQIANFARELKTPRENREVFRLIILINQLLKRTNEG